MRRHQAYERPLGGNPGQKAHGDGQSEIGRVALFKPSRG